MTKNASFLIYSLSLFLLYRTVNGDSQTLTIQSSQQTIVKRAFLGLPSFPKISGLPNITLPPFPNVSSSDFPNVTFTPLQNVTSFWSTTASPFTNLITSFTNFLDITPHNINNITLTPFPGLSSTQSLNVTLPLNPETNRNSQLPNVSFSNIPNYTFSTIPDTTFLYFDDVTSPSVRNTTFKQSPNVKIPPIPKIPLPSFPNITLPAFPNVTIPPIPKISFPSLPNITLPGLPNVSLPSISKPPFSIIPNFTLPEFSNFTTSPKFQTTSSLTPQNSTNLLTKILDALRKIVQEIVDILRRFFHISPSSQRLQSAFVVKNVLNFNLLAENFDRHLEDVLNRINFNQLKNDEVPDEYFRILANTFQQISFYLRFLGSYIQHNSIPELESFSQNILSIMSHLENLAELCTHPISNPETLQKLKTIYTTFKNSMSEFVTILNSKQCTSSNQATCEQFLLRAQRIQSKLNAC